jgi:hypothetical protein
MTVIKPMPPNSINTIMTTWPNVLRVSLITAGVKPVLVKAETPINKASQ